MSAITLAQARAKLDSLLAAETNNLRSVTIGGRTVVYQTAKELQEAIDYWSGWVTRLERRAAGARGGYAVADFRSRR